MVHNLLIRQLRKSNLDENSVPSLADWKSFLERVERTYQDADQERYLLERSLFISSGEMQDLYQKLQKSETRYALASKGANDGLWDWDLEEEDIYFSPRCLEILGCDPQTKEKPDRRWWFEKIHRDDRDRVLSEFRKHLQNETSHFENEHRISLGDQSFRWVLIRGLAIYESGRAIRIAGSATDITERKLAEQKLAHDAIHDALTGLPNRKFLMQRLSRSLDRAQLTLEYCFALLFIDLDKFKSVNDSYGHNFGDELLLRISEKLNYLVRPSDMVSRLGGDEFVVLIDYVTSKEIVSEIVSRIIENIAEPMEIGEHTIYPNASIGVAFGSNEYKLADDLIRDADVAMYCAKLKGHGNFEIFDNDTHLNAISHLKIQNDLHTALSNNEFRLVYQPIISVDTEKLVGFESLIRWHHPTRGLIMPNDFISIAEENGLIVSIGNWVLLESCKQMQKWRQEFSVAKDVTMNVNLSAIQLESEGFIDILFKILKETGLPPEFLKLEITESVLMKNTKKAIETVSKLRSFGIKFSIDDFGTGYSSLSYLHSFAIDTLKVDRSFIDKIGSENEKTEVTEAIISLALSLGIEVVAEGVETLEQLDFLRKNNCQYVQGYYYSKPVNGESATQMLEDAVLNDYSPKVLMQSIDPVYPLS